MAKGKAPVYVLFDIDGTLTYTGGAGYRATVRALDALYGIGWTLEGLTLHGLTDLIIWRDALLRAGLPDGRGAFPRAYIRTYLDLLDEEIARATGLRAHPGVGRLVDALAARPDVRLGLLTGNVAGGARRKLALFNLWRRFSFGAFGDDAIERPDLLPIALRRAGAGPSAIPRTVVVGDTPNDIAVARRHGARVVAVATGRSTPDDLRAADAVFPDFGDTPAALRAILDVR